MTITNLTLPLPASIYAGSVLQSLLWADNNLNTYFGLAAGNGTNGYQNTAMGELALSANLTGLGNTANGCVLCSVYGVSDRDFVDESSPVNPQTAYAVCKTLVERDVKELADERFSPVFLRNATAYGASPRMRFDIVLNNLAGLAWTTKEIKMTSDGTPWRPLVHALDIAQAVGAVLEAPREAVHNEVFNVGDTEHNYRVREIAELVGGAFPGCRVTFGPAGGDNRSYRVSFDKIRKHLPRFKCAWDARRGAEQLHKLFEQIDMQGKFSIIALLHG